jgi:transcriptional regulator of NAD metabolism
MNRAERLEAIREILESATAPVNGSFLAERFGVSRQAIVQDIALLRNQGLEIISTPAGYMLEKVKRLRKIIAVRHGKEDIFDELLAVVEAGGRVLDVMVDHPLYGEIRGSIGVASKEDVTRFVNMLESSGQEPLLSLTKGFHLHTIEADSEETLKKIEDALKKLGFLFLG